MQSKHAWTKVAKKNQWKYVKPIVKKAMKSGKMEAIGKTEGFIYTALDGIRRSVYGECYRLL